MSDIDSSRFLRAKNNQYLIDGDRWSSPFFFVQMADTQLGFFEDDTGGETWEKELANCEKAVESINKIQPKFVVVCGDLVHAYPASYFSSSARDLNKQANLYESQVSDFKKVMSKVDPAIELICLCGNHDIGNKPTRKTIQDYKDRFGDDYFSFWYHGVLSLVLNGSLYSDPSGAQDYHKEQEEWLDRMLEYSQKTKPTHLFVFQHQPWFLSTPDEENEYFNIPKERRMPALEKLSRANVRAVFAGHYHRNAYGKCGEMEMITTSAVGRPLGDDPSGLRIVKVFQDRIEHKYYSLDEVPDKIEL